MAFASDVSFERIHSDIPKIIRLGFENCLKNYEY